jgi:hypothetical protein
MAETRNPMAAFRPRNTMVDEMNVQKPIASMPIV